MNTTTTWQPRLLCVCVLSLTQCLSLSSDFHFLQVPLRPTSPLHPTTHSTPTLMSCHISCQIRCPLSSPNHLMLITPTSPTPTKLITPPSIVPSTQVHSPVSPATQTSSPPLHPLLLFHRFSSPSRCQLKLKPTICRLQLLLHLVRKLQACGHRLPSSPLFRWPVSFLWL